MTKTSTPSVRALRAAALFALLSLPVLWTLGLAGELDPGVRAWIDAPRIRVPLVLWGFSMLFALLACFGVAVWTVARDETMPAGSRTRWIIALLLANLAAAAVFVLVRWRRPHRGSRAREG
ncbi:MAG TPA: hypothetical protein VGB15_18275 [Longimicrobium sp.]|jgi:hypothetical protein